MTITNYQSAIKRYGATALMACFFSVYAQVACSEPIHFEGDDWDVTFTGYLRQYASVNLQDAPENPGDDSGRFSLVRTQFQPALVGHYKDVDFRLQTRSVLEVNTGYLQDLSDLGADNGNNLATDRYDVNEIRAAYLAFSPFDGTRVRVGRQQVAFGETDFFQSLDIIHGFDFTWRSFLVPENEDVRKPLNMVNVIQQVPDTNSSVQLVLIPGGDFNRDRDYGNSFDVYGGRFANQPNKGVNFLAEDVVPYNYDHPAGDTDEFTGAIRVKGLLGSIGYSLAYLRVHNPDPVVNSAFKPFKQAPKNGFAEFIFPTINAIGATANGYSSMLDTVFAGEAAYAFNKPYNVGQNASSCGAPFAGFCGIKEKDTLSLTLRADKTVDFAQTLLGASRPGFLSFQLFDDYIVGGVTGDDIVDLAGYSAPKKGHSVIATGIFGWNYMNDKVNPQIAGGYDVSYGGGFMIPSIQFVHGDHWRLKLEADLFFDDGSARTATFQDTRDTHIFGYFDNNDQFLARLTYQF